MAKKLKTDKINEQALFTIEALHALVQYCCSCLDYVVFEHEEVEIVKKSKVSALPWVAKMSSWLRTVCLTMDAKDKDQVMYDGRIAVARKLAAWVDEERWRAAFIPEDDFWQLIHDNYPTTLTSYQKAVHISTMALRDQIPGSGQITTYVDRSFWPVLIVCGIEEYIINGLNAVNPFVLNSDYNRLFEIGKAMAVRMVGIQ